MAVLAPATASAHDFWIEPSTYRPSVGETLKLDLRVGEFFAGESVARRPERILAFVAQGPGGTVDVAGQLGDLPAGNVVVSAPGGFVVGYRSELASIQLPADRFESYLAEAGLEHVIEARARAGASAEPGREAYSRCAKALVSTREPGESLHDSVLGFTLEIVARRDPRTLASGDALPLLVLLEGAPAADVLVDATPAADHEECQRARTDGAGAVTVRLDHAGAWIVRCVVMRPAARGMPADWESLWASLTFAVGE